MFFFQTMEYYADDIQFNKDFENIKNKLEVVHPTEKLFKTEFR